MRPLQKINRRTTHDEWVIQRAFFDFKEIDLVYEKAEANASIAAILAIIEKSALQEARSCIHLMEKDGTPLSLEQFDSMSDDAYTAIISSLSRLGLSKLSALLTFRLLKLLYHRPNRRGGGISFPHTH